MNVDSIVEEIELPDEVRFDLEKLYANNGYLLKQICHREMNHFGGISAKDYDDFYSRIGVEIGVALKNKKYDVDSNQTFLQYVQGIIRFSVQKEMTYRNRNKRRTIMYVESEDENGETVTKKEYVTDKSLDESIKDSENDYTLNDVIPSDFDLEEHAFQNIKIYPDNIESFLNSLSKKEREIVDLIMEGYSRLEIKEMLSLSDIQFMHIWTSISSYEKRRILIGESENLKEDEINMNETNVNIINETEDVSESYKNTSYSIESISKQLHKRRIRDDHILQRHSGQWKGFAKSSLISDVLRGKSLTQIIISEEMKNGLQMQWLIDGKQRCTTLDDYLNNGFAISKNIKNYNIRYQGQKYDENGKEVINEDGFAVLEWKVFDIRGKKFSHLPEELQDIFKDRQIPVLYNMNCTKKDIAEDIARFNRSRPMTKAQNGWLGLDEEFAEFAENIAKMEFFKPDFDGSSYTQNNSTSGAIRRIIVEAIMVSDFIDNFNKDFEKMCEFLSEEASDSNFTEFYSFVERLTSVADEEVAELFNAKNSFLWLGLFSRFANYGLDDKSFIDFMKAFKSSLYSKKVNGVTYEEMDKGSTKDKTIVMKKIKHLETLMKEFLHIEDTRDTTDAEIDKSEDSNDDTVENVIEIESKPTSEGNINSETNTNVLRFIREEVAPELISDDIELYSDMLNDYVKFDDPVNTEENLPSLLGIIAYACHCDNDSELEDWFEQYLQDNNTYDINQKRNFEQMKRSFDEFCVKRVA